MTIDLSLVPLCLVYNVDLLVVPNKHLGKPTESSIVSLPRSGVEWKLTIIALTNVFPPSTNEPAVAARVEEDAAASPKAIKELCENISIGRYKARVVKIEKR